MDTNKKIREYISAFADGELPDADLELALAALSHDDGRRTWELYHEIGDALRSEPGFPELSPGFATRLSERLAAESIPLLRPAARPATPAEALAAIAPAVLPDAGALNGATLAGPTHESAVPEPKPAVVKRV